MPANKTVFFRIFIYSNFILFLSLFHDITPIIPIIPAIPDKLISEKRRIQEKTGFIVLKVSPPVLARKIARTRKKIGPPPIRIHFDLFK